MTVESAGETPKQDAVRQETQSIIVAIEDAEAL